MNKTGKQRYVALQLHQHIQLMMTVDAEHYIRIRNQFVEHDMHEDKKMIEALLERSMVFKDEAERNDYVGYVLSTQYTLYELQQFYYLMKAKETEYWDRQYQFQQRQN